MPKISKGLSHPTYDYILNMILSKQLMPGDKISELQVARDFGVSRTPVRDAMRQLSNEGLVEIFPNRFARVAKYSDDEIREIGIVRIAMDTMAIKLAALYGSQADFLRLKQIAQNCCDAMKDGQISLRRKYDSDFHMELAVLSKNKMLLKFQKELYLRVQFIILHHPNPVENEKLHLKQHFQIADALMDYDESRALKLITDHLTTFYNLKDHFPPTFFDRIPFNVPPND